MTSICISKQFARIAPSAVPPTAKKYSRKPSTMHGRWSHIARRTGYSVGDRWFPTNCKSRHQLNNVIKIIRYLPFTFLPSQMKVNDYFTISHYLPEGVYQRNKEMAKYLRNSHFCKRGLHSREAEQQFIRFIQEMKEYGLHLYSAVWVCSQFQKIRIMKN